MQKKVITLAVIVGVVVLGSILSAATLNMSSAISKPKPSAAAVQALAKEFTTNIQGPISYLPDRKERLGGFEVPIIRSGDWLLNDHPLPLVDSFTARTGAVATIYVKIGDEFVRLATSVTTERDQDAAGTTLDHTTQGYKSLINGMRYTGDTVLFGKKFMADFNVLKDKNGQVIGAYLVAIPYPRT